MAVLALLLVGGCGGPLVEVTVVDERTAIENQILGTYREMDREMLLVASVRAMDANGSLVERPALPAGKSRVVRALQRSAFNKDDVDRLKGLGVLGENSDGGLTLLNADAAPVAERAFIQTLVAEENADRLVLMERVIETDEGLTPADLPKVRQVFAAMNRDRAAPGTLIQSGSGGWVKKEQ